MWCVALIYVYPLGIISYPLTSINDIEKSWGGSVTADDKRSETSNSSVIIHRPFKL